MKNNNNDKQTNKNWWANTTNKGPSKKIQHVIIHLTPLRWFDQVKTPQKVTNTHGQMNDANLFKKVGAWLHHFFYAGAAT